ncbi:MAG: glycerate kinase [Nitrospirae bacterium]|nr:glycerate kinase [Nitrospirota bacterium]
MNQNDNRKSAIDIFYSALKAVDPYESVKGHTDKVRSLYRSGNFSRLIVIAIGKAAYPMVNALEDDLIDIIDAGIVITKYGHVEGQAPRVRGQGSKIKIREAGHPLPDDNGVKGTEEIIKLLRDADEHTLVVCLISGGGSALLVSPYEGITLKEKQDITLLLLNAGADINDLNCVRKHISKVKGGRLAEIAYPARMISLILSDVIGDRLDVIASGPTSPDSTTYDDALSILRKYKLLDKTPHGVLDVLNKGADGLVPDTPKEGNVIFRRIDNIIIGSNRMALDAAREKAEELGFHAEIISAGLAGEAREIGKWLADKVRSNSSSSSSRSNRPKCFISGGETTVTVKGNGLGGRNMELALAFAMEIEGIAGITLLSAGTDGTDGPTDAAGAIVDGETISRAKAAGLDPEAYLANNDSYTFFKKTDNLFIPGPTGTNVMDMQIVVAE